MKTQIDSPPDAFTLRPPLSKPNRSKDYRSVSKVDCVKLLQELYEQVMARHVDSRMKRKSKVNAIRGKVDAFFMYRDFVAEDATVLDWGCCQAADSCLLRYALGDSVHLLGFDFDREDVYGDFHDYAALQFSKAEHPYLLPYEDNSIDVVISNGVLEHVAITSESLKEIYRVLKVDGIFVVAWLPNRLSYTEAIQRQRGSGHRRLYSRREMVDLLLNHGLDPQVVSYHHFIPAHRMSKLFSRIWFMNSFLERTWPFRCFSANHFAIAMKRRII